MAGKKKKESEGVPEVVEEEMAYQLPEEDIHEWNIKNVFCGDMEREDAKKKIFAWLYNPKALNKSADSVYNRESVVEKYFNGESVNTTFGREIPADSHHALNYVVQSTTSDLFLRQMCKVTQMLKGCKSFVSFCVHDSMVLDLHNDDKHMLPGILKTFSDTELGKYRVNVAAGKNFGDLRGIEWTQ